MVVNKNHCPGVSISRWRDHFLSTVFVHSSEVFVDKSGIFVHSSEHRTVHSSEIFVYSSKIFVRGSEEQTAYSSEIFAHSSEHETTQRADYSARRCRLRADVNLWRTDTDADSRWTRGERVALHALSRRSIVFAHARFVVDGPESSRGGHGHNRKLVQRQSRLHWIDSQVRRVCLGDSSSKRLLDCKHRQVASDS